MPQTIGVFVKQVVFLTVNHRGPLPLRELHSTDETIVWRDPGGSWACLPLVYDYMWNHTAIDYDVVKQVFSIFVVVDSGSPRTLTPDGTSPTKQWCGETLGDLEPVYDYTWNHPGQAVTQTNDTFVKQVVFLTVNHRGPLPLGELHSTDETIVWRDPGGSWACLRPVLQVHVAHTARGKL